MCLIYFIMGTLYIYRRKCSVLRIIHGCRKSLGVLECVPSQKRGSHGILMAFYFQYYCCCCCLMALGADPRAVAHAGRELYRWSLSWSLLSYWRICHRPWPPATLPASLIFRIPDSSQTEGWGRQVRIPYLKHHMANAPWQGICH